MALTLLTCQVTDEHVGEDVVQVNLNQPMDKIRAQLSQYPIRTRLSLTGGMVVARDIAHAKILVRMTCMMTIQPATEAHG